MIIIAILFDLDGVLRMFGSYALGFEPDDWDAKHNGKSVIDIINERPEMCAYCPESEYLPIVNEKLDHITILTNQLDRWIPFTEIWLQRHIKIPYDVVYTKNSDQKLTYLGKHDWIVEDFPKFKDYSNIALITRNYNKKLNVPLRISNVDEFTKFLEETCI